MAGACGRTNRAQSKAMIYSFPVRKFHLNDKKSELQRKLIEILMFVEFFLSFCFVFEKNQIEKICFLSHVQRSFNGRTSPSDFCRIRNESERTCKE